jgi:hypothetical protein
VRTPKLSAEHAIGPALGQYRAAPPGDGSSAGPAGGVSLVPMVNGAQGRCPQGSYECPFGGANYIC